MHAVVQLVSAECPAQKVLYPNGIHQRAYAFAGHAFCSNDGGLMQQANVSSMEDGQAPAHAGEPWMIRLRSGALRQMTGWIFNRLQRQ